MEKPYEQMKQKAMNFSVKESLEMQTLPILSDYLKANDVAFYLSESQNGNGYATLSLANWLIQNKNNPPKENYNVIELFELAVNQGCFFAYLPWIEYTTKLTLPEHLGPNIKKPLKDYETLLLSLAEQEPSAAFVFRLLAEIYRTSGAREKYLNMCQHNVEFGVFPAAYELFIESQNHEDKIEAYYWALVAKKVYTFDKNAQAIPQAQQLLDEITQFIQSVEG